MKPPLSTAIVSCAQTRAVDCSSSSFKMVKQIVLENFYENREIFITGGSGYIGKAIIEKILRTFNVKRIFLLLRSKKGKSLADRMEALRNDVIFSVLKQSKPDEVRKLVPVEGDVSELKLGLSEESLDLMKNVSIIIHSAATINFNEPLQNAILINVRGTLESLKIAESLPNLATFCHISTMYCNCDRTDYIEEKIYPPPADWRMCLELAVRGEEELLNVITKKILCKFPNTYTLTKNLAEQVVQEYFNQIPITIVRPAIVMCALSDPFKGYVDSLAGSNGIMAIGGTGLLRSILCPGDTVLSNVCLEGVVRGSIIATWKLGSKSVVSTASEPYICHNHGAYYTDVQLKKQLEAANKMWKKYAFTKIFWKPYFMTTECKSYYYLRVIAYQITPAILLDLGLRISGKKPFGMKMQRVLYSNMELFDFFLHFNLKCRAPNMDAIFADAEDCPDFAMSHLMHKSMEWYLECILPGCRKYIIKDDDATLPDAQRRFKLFEYADLAVRWGFYSLLAKLAYSKIHALAEDYFV